MNKVIQRQRIPCKKSKTVDAHCKYLNRITPWHEFMYCTVTGYVKQCIILNKREQYDKTLVNASYCFRLNYANRLRLEAEEKRRLAAVRTCYIFNECLNSLKNLSKRHLKKIFFFLSHEVTGSHTVLCKCRKRRTWDPLKRDSVTWFLTSFIF